MRVATIELHTHFLLNLSVYQFVTNLLLTFLT
jgi:hypothetical protein